MPNAAMAGPNAPPVGQIEPQAIKVLVQLLVYLQRNGPQSWPQLYQMAVRAGVPEQVLPPPNAPPQAIAEFAKRLVKFLRAYGVGSRPMQPQQPQQPQQPPVQAMAYGGPVLDVTVGQDRPALAMMYGGRVDDIPALLSKGEYVASEGALRHDPTLADRISRANRAASGGMEGPILLAQDRIPAGGQVIYMETNPDFFGERKPVGPSADEGPRYNTSRDPVADANARKPPSDEALKRHIKKAAEEIERNKRKRR